jgi:hypothetical protein
MDIICDASNVTDRRFSGRLKEHVRVRDHLVESTRLHLLSLVRRYVKFCSNDAFLLVLSALPNTPESDQSRAWYIGSLDSLTCT